MREKIEGILAELQQELRQVTQQEAQARAARLRLEGAVSTLQLLLQDGGSTQPGGQEGVTDGGNN